MLLFMILKFYCHTSNMFRFWHLWTQWELFVWMHMVTWLQPVLAEEWLWNIRAGWGRSVCLFWFVFIQRGNMDLPHDHVMAVTMKCTVFWMWHFGRKVHNLCYGHTSSLLFYISFRLRHMGVDVGQPMEQIFVYQQLQHAHLGVGSTLCVPCLLVKQLLRFKRVNVL